MLKPEYFVLVSIYLPETWKYLSLATSLFYSDFWSWVRFFSFQTDLRTIPETSLMATFNTHVISHTIPTQNIHAFFSRKMWCDFLIYLDP